jgi:hypothetical protein
MKSNSWNRNDTAGRALPGGEKAARGLARYLTRCRYVICILDSAMRLRACVPCLILPLLAAGASPLAAASNLLENSPFLPPNVAAGAAQEATPLELRSVLLANGAYEFSLYDPVKKRSTWATLNEAGHEFVVKAFDSVKQTVTVEQRNRTFQLTLKEAKIALLNTAAASPASMTGGPPVPGAPAMMPTMLRGPGGQPIGPGGGRSPGVPAPTLTPEQLRNLEADINRRRELRRQAVAAPAAGAPANPPPQR